MDARNAPMVLGVAEIKKYEAPTPIIGNAYARVLVLTKIPRSAKREADTASPTTGRINRTKSLYSPSVRSGRVSRHTQRVITGIPAAKTPSASSFGLYFETIMCSRPADRQTGYLRVHAIAGNRRLRSSSFAPCFRELICF